MIWGGCLVPLATLVYWFVRDDLTANPISFVTTTLGDWTLRILLASLAMTPIRLVLGVSWPNTLRRLLGLFAFFYVCLHGSVWIVLDFFFDWPRMWEDIVKRPYITLGMLGLLSLLPLALTSTRGWIKRLGARTWTRLHRLAYLAGVFGCLHFLWLAKVGRTALATGDTLIAQEHRASAVVALQLWVRVGGRDESPEELGLSHYLEHMLFKGTPTRPPGAIDELIEGLGGTSNAFTSYDYTHYDVVLPAGAMRAGLELLADIGVNASFPPQELESEKKVVFEEMGLVEDDPEKFLGRRLTE